MGHDLYLKLQELWLHEVGGPGLMFCTNIAVGILATMAAAAALKNTVRDIELENTWGTRNYRISRTINWVMVIGLILLALAFFGAAFFEQGRLTSPVRLVVPRSALTVVLLGTYWNAIFWRGHYKRKRSIIKIKQELQEEGRQ